MEKKKLVYIIALTLFALSTAIYTITSAGTLVERVKVIQTHRVVLNANCTVDKQEGCNDGFDGDCSSFVNCTLIIDKELCNNTGIISSDSRDNSHSLNGTYAAYAAYNPETKEIIRLAWNKQELVVDDTYVANTFFPIILSICSVFILLGCAVELVNLLRKKNSYQSVA